MKRKVILVLAFFLIAGIAWLQVLPPRAKPLSELIPSGALLSIEAKDFGAQLNDWNQSQAKAKWLVSQNSAEFLQSNLLKKMSAVFEEYTRASDFAPGLAEVLEIAGTESAFALYDPHELQFLYITKLTNAQLTKSQLWALRNKFETRESAGKTFYLRGTGTRTVAFAESGDYLFLATSDELVAKALALQNGAVSPRLSDERWYATATKSSSGTGDLRLLLNLGALVKNTYFRSYWVQRNVSDLKPFTAEVCDLDRKGNDFIERRVLVRDLDSHPALVPESSRLALQQLVDAAPQDAGLYRAWADTDAKQVAELIEEKLLFPRVEARQNRRYAPAAPDESSAGSEADLETRIDQAPLPIESIDTPSTLLQSMLSATKIQASILIQSSETPSGSSFVATPSVIGITAANDWDEARVRDSITRALSAQLSTDSLGLKWVTAGQSIYKLDGLMTLFIASRGRTVYLSNREALISEVVSRPLSVKALNANTYVASFRHSRERQPYFSIMRALDFASVSPAEFGYTSPNRPAFFSGNLGSLDEALSNVRAIDVTEQQLPDSVIQIVHYY